MNVEIYYFFQETINSLLDHFHVDIEALAICLNVGRSSIYAWKNHKCGVQIASFLTMSKAIGFDIIRLCYECEGNSKKIFSKKYLDLMVKSGFVAKIKRFRKRKSKQRSKD